MKAKIDKRLYERPRMTVVELQHRAAVLVEGSRNGYGKANTGVDPKELDGDGIWNWD